MFEAKLHFPAPNVAFARQAQLSFMAFYNATNSVGGFNQLLNGLVPSQKTQIELEEI